MLLGILVIVGYLLVSFITDMVILGTIGHKMYKLDENVNVPTEGMNAALIYVALSFARILGLIFLISLLYNKDIPVVVFIVITILEIYRGVSQMFSHDEMGRPAMRNYYTGKTIGSFIGLALMTYWVYFK